MRFLILGLFIPFFLVPYYPPPPESEIGKTLMSKFMRQLDKLDIDHYNPDDFDAHVSKLAAQVA